VAATTPVRHRGMGVGCIGQVFLGGGDASWRSGDVRCGDDGEASAFLRRWCPPAADEGGGGVLQQGEAMGTVRDHLAEERRRVGSSSP
jgi:hypothetical protein